LRGSVKSRWNRHGIFLMSAILPGRR